MRDEVQFQPGTSISKKIRIEALIGRGGMAEVYAARHLLLDETVAVKVLRRELLTQKDVVGRFLREARASARVRSEHAVVIYDVDELESGQPIIVMEKLEGEDVAAVLERRGRLPVAEGVDLVIQACRAVRVAHQQGIVHRDIKPANLFLARTRAGTNVLKVLDFGISKSVTRAGGDGPASSITQIGTLLGSPRYMAPEQMVDARNVDARSDIWALACTAYRIVTGVPPFDGTSIPEICGAVLAASPQPANRVAPDVPAELAAVLSRGMSKFREDRYPDLDAFIAALEPFARQAAPRPAPAPIEDPATAVSTVVPSVPTVPIAHRDPTEVPPSSTTVRTPAPDVKPWLGATVVSGSHPSADASLRFDATAEGASLDRSLPAKKSRVAALVVTGVALVVFAAGAFTLWRRLGGASDAASAARSEPTADHGVAGASPPSASPPSASPPSASPASASPPSAASALAAPPAVEPQAAASAPSSDASAPGPTSIARPSPAGAPAPRRAEPPPVAPAAGVPDPFGGSQK